MKQALIVDDSKTACKVLSRALMAYDIQSTSVYSANDALAQLEFAKPDIIFMDHDMPGLSGLETVKIIKANPDTAKIPVIMYTAEKGELYLGQARALGAVDVLAKGQEMREIKQALIKLGLVDAGSRPEIESIDSVAVDPKSDRELEVWMRRLQSEMNRHLYMLTDEVEILGKEQTKSLLQVIGDSIDKHEDNLVLRIENKNNLMNLDAKIENQARFRTVTAVIGLVLLVQIVLVWQFLSVQEENRQFASKLEHTQGQVTSLMLALETARDDMFYFGEYLTMLADKPSPTANGPHHDKPRSLMKDLKPFLVKAYPNQGNGAASHLSAGDYLYPYADCNGEALVVDTDQVIYLDGANQLWYMTKEGALTKIVAESKMGVDKVCKSVL